MDTYERILKNFSKSLIKKAYLCLNVEFERDMKNTKEELVQMMLEDSAFKEGGEYYNKHMVTEDMLYDFLYGVELGKIGN